MPNRPPPQRITRQTKADAVVDGVRCCFCEEAVPVVGEQAQLKPCGCIVHPRCLIDAHARRGTSLLSCPRCCLRVGSHIHLSERVPVAPAVPCNDGSASPMSDDTLQRFYPLQFLMRKEIKAITDPSSSSEYLLLYAVRISSAFGTERFATTSVTKVLACPTRGAPLDDCNRLCEFFAFLYPLLTTPSMTPRSKINILRLPF